MTARPVATPVAENTHKALYDEMPRLLCAFFMLLKAANNLLYLAVMTTLLDKAGANALPWVYLLVNVIFIAIQFGAMTYIVGREGHWLLSMVSIPAALVSFVAAWIFPTDLVPLLIGFFVLTMLLDLTTNQGFTAMLNHFISINDAKRLMPLIYASGSFGFILSGLLLKFILDFAGLKGLLLLNGLLVLVSSVILKMLRPVEALRCEEQARTDQVQNLAGEACEVTPSLRHPLARLLIFSSYIILFNKYLVDFLFAAALSQYFTASNSLASFMGVFGATADFAVIGLQTFVMHRVFARFPIGRVLTFMPLVLMILCSLAAFSSKFALIATVQFLVLLNSKNFTVPATTIFMGIIPQRDRILYRRDLSIACSISSASVGVFLLLVRGRISYELLFLIAALCYLLLAWLHARLDAAYLSTLRSAMVSRSESDSDNQVASLQYVQLSERLEQLKLLLGDPDPAMRLRAVDAVAGLPHRYALELLETQLVAETDARCLNAVARNLLSINPEYSARHIIRLLAETEDNRLRSDIIEAIGKTRMRAISEDVLLEYLDHQHHRVAASAVISVVRLTRQPENLARAMRKLAEMTCSAVELMRASAAAVMGELGLPLFVPALESLAAENDTMVAANAATALSRIQTPAAMAALERLLLHENDAITRKAEELLEIASRDSISRVGRLLAGITSEERGRLSAKLRSGAHQESMELLAAILCVEDPEKRRGLIRVLEKADTDLQLLMSRCVVQISDSRVELTTAPLIASARQVYSEELPVWAPLLNVIAAGSLENPEENTRQLLPLEHLLTSLWCEFAVAVEMKLTADPSWKAYCLNQIRLVAYFSREPAAILKSFIDISSGATLKRGMAIEYLETRLGRQISRKIIPLIDPNITIPADLAGMQAMAAERDIDMNPESLTNARQRLPKIINQETRL
ncbi:MAG TPA: HEAT repeat domain-containing protein [Candidatus Rifleibacterium sp.]|nr:HEAT repeat domain-containing protein [Candidatus Rifleibacterium sp.]